MIDYSSQFSTIQEAVEPFSQHIMNVILSEMNKKTELYYARNGKTFSTLQKQKEIEEFKGLLIIF